MSDRLRRIHHFAFYDRETKRPIMTGQIELPELLPDAKPFRVEMDPATGEVRFGLDGGFDERVTLRTSEEEP